MSSILARMLLRRGKFELRNGDRNMFYRFNKKPDKSRYEVAEHMNYKNLV